MTQRVPSDMIDIVQAGRRRLQEMHAAKRVAEEGKRQAQAAGFVTAWRALKKAVCDQLPAFLLAYLPLDSLAPGETMHPGSEPRIALTIPGPDGGRVCIYFRPGLPTGSLPGRPGGAGMGPGALPGGSFLRRF
ncbi:MAG: hypothetical protein L0332_06980 [Chloroflexi bacterium]|nr:hypothetical protein [Chloroflexota bacterium]MCI0647942.1 hypothetical protein [Chloroflexota bacterium]MCI0726452.1 hypothetical protein [Chloroflexota bacterium]